MTSDGLLSSSSSWLYLVFSLPLTFSVLYGRNSSSIDVCVCGLFLGNTAIQLCSMKMCRNHFDKMATWSHVNARRYGRIDHAHLSGAHNRKGPIKSYVDIIYASQILNKRKKNVYYFDLSVANVTHHGLLFCYCCRHRCRLSKIQHPEWIDDTSIKFHLVITTNDK